MKMNSPLERLQKRYGAFIEEERLERFWEGLIEYVGWIDHQPYFIPMLESFEARKEVFFSRIVDLAPRVLNELDEAREKIVEILAKNGVESAGIQKCLSELVEHDAGKFQVLRAGYAFKRDPFYINNKLHAMSGILRDEGLEELFDEFLIAEGRVSKLQRKYGFSETFPELWHEQERLVGARKNEVWFQWEWLRDASIIYQGAKEAPPTLVTDFRSTAQKLQFYLLDEIGEVSGVGDVEASELSEVKSEELDDSPSDDVIEIDMERGEVRYAGKCTEIYGTQWYYLLERLMAENRGSVEYEDLKSYVLKKSKGASTELADRFCQNLKYRFFIRLREKLGVPDELCKALIRVKMGMRINYL